MVSIDNDIFRKKRFNETIKKILSSKENMIDFLKKVHPIKDKIKNMKQEDKELLLKDLCARLPYNVIVEYGVKYEGRDLGEKKGKLTGRMLDSYFYNITVGMSDVYSIKPYLRPMSSMTEEEKIDYQAFFNYDGVEYPEEYIDWLNKHHFDYHGLIEKGLAIAVDENNNPYKD